MTNIAKNTKTNTILGMVAILALFSAPMIGSDVQANKSVITTINDGEVVDYIEDLLESVGTTVKEETKSGDTLVTTNTVTEASANEFTLVTTATINGEVANNETFQITKNSDGTYRLVNTVRDIDLTFSDTTTNTRGSATISSTSAKINLVDSGTANDGDVLGLSDTYNWCGNARFDAGVVTTGDTLITWDAYGHFWSHCFIYEGFDYVKIQHEGHTEYSDSLDSSVTMSNSNGAGTYQVRVTVYYD